MNENLGSKDVAAARERTTGERPRDTEVRFGGDEAGDRRARSDMDDVMGFGRRSDELRNDGWRMR